jgi:hypothetical protein
VLWLRSSPITKRVINPSAKSQRNHISHGVFTQPGPFPVIRGHGYFTRISKPSCQHVCVSNIFKFAPIYVSKI